MSSLLFATFDEQAFVATDTLATSTDGTASFFTTKVIYLPHLRTLLACTGVAGFLDRWVVWVNSGIDSFGVEGLNEKASSQLAALWQWYKQQLPIGSRTTTVYHFGLSERTGRLLTYAYRSTTGFQSELLMSPGVGSKPPIEFPEGCTFPDIFPSLMKQQRRKECRKPIDQRVFIGGEVIVFHLSRDGCAIFNSGRLSDYKRAAVLISKRQGESH